MKNKTPKVFAVSGVKNSGKTTLIEKIVSRLNELDYKVGVIKHDGHEFVADHEGTDTDRHKKAGAKSVMIYSDTKMMLIQDCYKARIEELIQYQKDMDIVIVEGMKYSNLPKIEIVRGEISSHCVCDKETLLAVVSDLPLENLEVPIVGLEDIDRLLEIIKEKILL
nr:molybdopterin-guanine dinucleotide biosynthesis protein B [uncultured Niameybacter sp.]